MQKIRLICVGKLKERWLKEGCAEYIKRLSAYCNPEIVEVADEPAPERLSTKQQEQIMLREGERLLKALGPSDYVVALTLQGKMRSSEELSLELASLAQEGRSTVAFLIGGSLGLGENVRQAAQVELCLSPMTMPHQLCRVVLLEQIYRAYGIQKGTAYHK